MQLNVAKQAFWYIIKIGLYSDRGVGGKPRTVV